MRNPLTDCPGCGAPIGENCLNVSTECRVRIRQSTTASKALAHLSEGEHTSNQIIDCPGCGTAWGSKCHDLSVQCYMRADYKAMAAGHRTAPRQPAGPLSEEATIQRVQTIREQEEHQLAVSKEAARKEFLGEVDKISPKFISPQEIINAATHGSVDETNPKDLQGMKKPPIRLIPPVALIYEAMVMALGAKKYGPFNWREKKVRLSIYVEAAQRHLMALADGQDLDPESGQPHAAHVRACMGIVLDALEVGKLVDDRPLAGGAPALLDRLTIK